MATMIGTFENRHFAEAAYRDLRNLGYEENDIGLFGKDITTRKGDNPTDDTNAEEGLAVGTAAGAAAGAAVGLGVLAGVIPVIGPAIAAGTLGVILTNALGGAVVAGVAGTLIGLGIPENYAKLYEKDVEAGRYLVSADMDAKEEEHDVRNIFYRHRGLVHTRS